MRRLLMAAIVVSLLAITLSSNARAFLSSAASLLLSGGTMTGDINMDDDVRLCLGDTPESCLYYDGTRVLLKDQVANVGFHILNSGISSSTSHFMEINGGALDTRLALVSTTNRAIMEMRAGVSQITGFRFYQNSVFRGKVEMQTDGSLFFGNSATVDVMDITQGSEITFNNLVVFKERSSTMILGPTNKITVLNPTINIVSSGGAVSMTSTPTIFAPDTNGTRVTLWGTSDTDMVTLQDADVLTGTGLKLNGDTNFTLGLDDNITLEYKASGFWCEVSRVDN